MGGLHPHTPSPNPATQGLRAGSPVCLSRRRCASVARMTNALPPILLALITATFAGITQTTIAQEAYRCGNSYSSEPCPGGRPIDTSPALADPRGATTTVIYLCRAHGGSRYWTREPCADRGWTIVRTERVPIAPWSEQLDAAKAQYNEAKELTRPPQETYTQQQPKRDTKTEQCAPIRARLEYLEEEGRRGGGPQKMEWLREEHRKAKDAYNRLNC